MLFKEGDFIILPDDDINTSNSGILILLSKDFNSESNSIPYKNIWTYAFNRTSIWYVDWYGGIILKDSDEYVLYAPSNLVEKVLPQIPNYVPFRSYTPLINLEIIKNV